MTSVSVAAKRPISAHVEQEVTSTASGLSVCIIYGCVCAVCDRMVWITAFSLKLSKTRIHLYVFFAFGLNPHWDNWGVLNVLMNKLKERTPPRANPTRWAEHLRGQQRSGFRSLQCEPSSPESRAFWIGETRNRTTRELGDKFYSDASIFAKTFQFHQISAFQQETGKNSWFCLVWEIKASLVVLSVERRGAEFKRSVLARGSVCDPLTALGGNGKERFQLNDS